ncbi:SAM-dependent methyltransferase [Campylobacter pinnipediorum subsp. caledonicus]|uniref:SAM-dependent methyltransferase n=1 Tax=Campylobacter pinnipediorum subsp. caledonicus TaxID=1874362 RepID=A0A1S6U9S8_9BACT|nr:class I SAM-dependent methyltransferase [Campylobacter pinnipediorum]AQW86795.1 SAM-dependent methyltransferase [Campylobacter pinnipediorum subsp. caledonicus]AQW88450.1 SAM-dependent methyltransferase [Campylobacter pinnipediorum subsp. caledonicus]OPA72585.1 hypothetical protein BB381_05140 [Campylobacter pinnipediorum subsp. caledonicus]
MQSNKDFWSDTFKNKKDNTRYPDTEFVGFCFRNLPKKASVLDVCCGAGRHVRFLSENDFKTYACDVAEGAIEYTGNLINSLNLKADLKVIKTIANLPYDNNAFDALISSNALFYATKDELEQNAHEIYRVLKEGGKAFLTLRSINDYRHINAVQNGKYDVIVYEKDNSRQGYKENGMKCHNFDKEEVLRIYSKAFKNIEINKSTISRQNDTILDESFIVILTK